MLAPSWLPTWGHLGGKDGSKSEKMATQIYLASPPGLFLNTALVLTLCKTVLASIFWGKARSLKFVGRIFASTGHALGMFSAALAGGLRPPDLPLPGWFSFPGHALGMFSAALAGGATPPPECTGACSLIPSK